MPNYSTTKASFRAVLLLSLIPLFAFASQKNSDAPDCCIYASTAGFYATILPNATLALEDAVFDYHTTQYGDIVSENFIFSRLFYGKTKVIPPFTLINTMIEKTTQGSHCFVIKVMKNGVDFGQYCISKSRGILWFKMENLQGGDSFELASRIGIFGEH